MKDPVARAPRFYVDAGEHAARVAAIERLRISVDVLAHHAIERERKKRILERFLGR